MTQCPKCGQALAAAVGDGALAPCQKCGLARDRMAAFAAARPLEAPEVIAAWEVLLTTWDDDTRHATFIELARQREALPLAARCYRDYQLAQPQDATAAKQLARVTKLVQVQMAATVAARVATERPPYQKVVVMLTVLTAMALAAWVYFDVIAKKSPARPSTPALREQPRPAKPYPNADERRRLRQQNKGGPPPTRQRVPWTPEAAK